MTITCAREIHFCAGHRVMGHENKCANAHGHQYKAVIHAQGKIDPLDPIGRVVDFSVLKAVFEKWIDTYWDHTFIVNREDSELLEFLKKFQQKQPFELPYNPTAENMALFLLKNSDQMLLLRSVTNITVVRVDVWETPKCFATATR